MHFLYSSFLARELLSILNFIDQLRLKNIKESPYLRFNADIKNKQEFLNDWILYKDLSKERNGKIWASSTLSSMLNQYSKSFRRSLKFMYKDMPLRLVLSSKFKNPRSLTWSFLETERIIDSKVELGSKKYSLELFLPEGPTLLEVEIETPNQSVSSRFDIFLHEKSVVQFPVKESKRYPIYIFPTFGKNTLEFYSRDRILLKSLKIPSPRNLILLFLPSQEAPSKNECLLSYHPSPDLSILLPIMKHLY